LGVFADAGVTAEKATSGQDLLKKLASGFEGETGPYKTALDSAVAVLAHVYVVNSIFSQADHSDESKFPKFAAKWLDHIQRTLQYHPTKLNKVLHSKVLPQVPASKVLAAAAAQDTQDNSATAAGAAGSSSSRENDRVAVGSTAEPPKKKLRKWGKS
jgi:hypothetical protein